MKKKEIDMDLMFEDVDRVNLQEVQGMLSML
jgi:hypothetical protein